MGLSLTDNARIVLEKRYLKKDEKGRPRETSEELFDRVAGSIAEADRLFDPEADVAKTKKNFLNLFQNLWFLPNSPTLMNAGRKLGQLAACFVLPIEDSMESIFDALKNTALIHKSGGGTGFAFSRIRPENDLVMSTAGVSSGPLSFMSVFDVATETVKQGGTRRGANMAVLRVDHPDIEAFITSKNNPEALTNFNISVGLTDRFMAAYFKDADYDLINPRTGKTVRCISAGAVFDQLISSAWQTGEPGVLFLDHINRNNPTPHLGDIEATNPCGEQPLLAYESCTLGSINLARMVSKNRLNADRLKKTVTEAVHFLDNVIEINRYPLAQIEKVSKQNRKIGLGVMGFADMLITLGIPYDSEDAIDQAETVMALISDASRDASAQLARQRGNYPAYQHSRHDQSEISHVRNATTTTIAPTGTISLIAGTSSGVEPIFAVAHARKVLDGETLFEMHPQFVAIAKKRRFYSDVLAREIVENGSVQSLDKVPDDVKALFRTSHDIAPIWHVRIQAAFQKYTDNAVSKTVNLPAQATHKDIRDIYLAAYEQACKGVTIYRYGSRDQQVLQIGSLQKESARIAPRPRPQRTSGITERIQTGCGKRYVLMGICPECSGVISHEEGCLNCHSCGYTKCS